MIKSILVALDGSEHANAALDHALWMAERTRGRVTGLHVINIVSIEGSFMHDISGSLGFEPYLDFSAKMRDALRERGEVLLDAFEKRCKERSVGCDRVLGMGIVANEICEQARLADLVAIGHRGINEQFSSGLLGSTTESVTRKSPKPVFVAPMKFAEPKRPLTVLHMARDEGDARKVLDEARRYLEPYGLEIRCESHPGPSHEGIVQAIREHGYDLLFIGAYGHSRIIEMVLGSTTEYVLRNSPCPVFLTR